MIFRNTNFESRTSFRFYEIGLNTKNIYSNSNSHCTRTTLYVPEYLHTDGAWCTNSRVSNYYASRPVDHRRSRPLHHTCRINRSAYRILNEYTQVYMLSNVPSRFTVIARSTIEYDAKTTHSRTQTHTHTWYPCLCATVHVHSQYIRMTVYIENVPK